jgi:hypothetical protein
VLRDVHVQDDGPVTAFQRDAPVLFAGSELLVLGRFDPGLRQLTGNVTAQAPDGARRYAFHAPVLGEGDAGVLPRLVASEEIRHLEDLIAAEGAHPDWVQRITDLAVRFGFVTEYTSLVVTLPPEARPVFANQCAACGAVASNASGAGGSSAGAPAPPPAPAPAAPPGSLPQAVPMLVDADHGADTGSVASAGSPVPSQDADLQRQLDPKGAAKTPGFEAFAALAAVGLAVALRARRR